MGGRAEVRDVHTGKMCEIVEYEQPSIPTHNALPPVQKIGFGFKPIHLVRVDNELLALTTNGLIILNEVSRPCLSLDSIRNAMDLLWTDESRRLLPCE